MTTQQGEMGGDVDTVELRGKVKWFNAVKGYGFLALDSDNSDAFLHVTTLRQSGHEDLKPGATVVCAGVRGPKGWQVMKVLDVDQSTAIAVAPKPPAVPDGIAMGEYITALGGHPSLGIGKLLESEKHDIGAILEESLTHEREALDSPFVGPRV